MESQIAAECLGIPLSSVQITAADTGLTPYNTGTFGSSQTFICGNAVKLACDDLKKKMVEQLKVIYDGCTVKEKDHRYYISGGEELELSFEDAARKILFDPKGSVPIGAGTYKGSWPAPTRSPSALSRRNTTRNSTPSASWTSSRSWMSARPSTA